MRCLAILTIVATLAACDSSAPADGLHARTGWARARKRPTQLVRRGPAPTRWDEPEPPPGVERVVYRSGELELAAWLAVPAERGRERRRPAVVYLHGWFGLRSDAWEGAKRFLDRGFVVLVPMFRGE